MQTRLAIEKERAQRHGQLHLFRFWLDLTEAQKEKLLSDSEKIDYGFVGSLFEKCVKEKKDERIEKLDPPISVRKYPHTEETEMAKKIGEESIRNGETAVFLVAGGQGSRLGFDGPKGCFPGTPITGKPLFQIFAEKILASQKKYNVRLEWFIMTSDENREPTEDFFAAHNYFSLEKDQIHFFTQESLPAVNENGKILMKSKYEIFFSPNGTGGIYSALKNTGMLDIMKEKDIKYLTYIQVDNALSQVADPVYVGTHILTASEITPKVMTKSHAHEPIGVIVRTDGVQRTIEYVVLSKEDAEKKDEKGELLFRMGNSGKQLISVDFIEKVANNKLVTFNSAFKKVPHIDEEGNAVLPQKPNGYKFESFVFDPMPHARTVAFEVLREEEFAPIKNADGEDSPKTSYAMQTALFKEWLRHAQIPEHIINHLRKVEISPLFAIDKEEFKEKISGKKEDVIKLLSDVEEYFFDC